MIKAHFSGDKIFSSSEEAFALYEKSRFGEKEQDKIIYSSVEAIFLIGEGKMELFSGKKQVSEAEFIKKLKKTDKKIETKSIVYRDLRSRGYIPKTALKYGAEFRVYDKGVKPGESHARWIIFTAKENELLNWHDFAARNRIAHSVKKSLLIGLVDEESAVTYYEIFWIKP